MKINSLDKTNFKGYSSAIKRAQYAAADKFAKIDKIGEGTNIALDFIGKAILVPATIMAASKEPKEKKEYSALKNPVAAAFQLMMEAPILMLGSSFVANLANKGKLDREGSNFSYNEKLYKLLSIVNHREKQRQEKREKENETA